MKNTLITSLKGRSVFGGELLFDDCKISFRNDTGLFWLNIVVFGFLCLTNALSWHSHYNSTDLFDQIIYPLSVFICIFYIMITIIKYPTAKKMNNVEFKPENLKSVCITKTYFSINFTFKLQNSTQQKFKCKQDWKTDKLIAFLKKSEVELMYE
ncbi:hypothetical protein ACT3CE_06360 [Marinifilum sp. RC60d5]|uniref:hypothetical protein n=1 Tax=Marinifilum sp. RC60d5 TaxID=3458414 RepID=UPI004034FE6D